MKNSERFEKVTARTDVQENPNPQIFIEYFLYTF